MVGAHITWAGAPRCTRHGFRGYGCSREVLAVKALGKSSHERQRVTTCIQFLNNHRAFPRTSCGTSIFNQNVPNPARAPFSAFFLARFPRRDCTKVNWTVPPGSSCLPQSSTCPASLPLRGRAGPPAAPCPDKAPQGLCPPPPGQPHAPAAFHNQPGIARAASTRGAHGGLRQEHPRARRPR